MGGFSFATLRRYLEALPSMLPEPPKAILITSAHWEAPVVTVSTAARPGMLYDYGGFPPETYRIVYPAPGEPTLAARVRALLAAAGLPAAEDAQRGYDHGTFAPLAVAWPNADVPVVAMSLVRTLDPALHLRIGRALAPLRDEGVLIVGSGNSYHNFGGFRTAEGKRLSAAFDAWLTDVVGRPAEARDAALVKWADAPGGRHCHPREEHLIPLMVMAGAAGADTGTVPFRHDMAGTLCAAVHFG